MTKVGLTVREPARATGEEDQVSGVGERVAESEDGGVTATAVSSREEQLVEEETKGDEGRHLRTVLGSPEVVERARHPWLAAPVEKAHVPWVEVPAAAADGVTAEAVLVPPVPDRCNVAGEHQQEGR
ncbi:hypothetical protein B296_00006842 [Ensete ventricosum]|uniref:Uncharacterized protein n=1 Tax=Ensete ventricosum TaxID=4639 RepID=A0A426Y9M0_ENSVE|nr:hypothetical protein B296_00006842 [Ensete ventricosum]